MAAPVAAVRVIPTAFKLRNGYQALLVFSADTNCEYYEISVGLPGMTSGDAIENTTQQNAIWRTMGPRTLVTLEEFQVTAGYDPIVYSSLLNILGVEQTVTIIFPDTSTLAFFGFLRSVEFDPLVDGTMPQLTMTITPTNYDPVHCVEAGPVLTHHGTC